MIHVQKILWILKCKIISIKRENYQLYIRNSHDASKTRAVLQFLNNSIYNTLQNCKS